MQPKHSSVQYYSGSICCMFSVLVSLARVRAKVKVYSSEKCAQTSINCKQAFRADDGGMHTNCKTVLYFHIAAVEQTARQHQTLATKKGVLVRKDIFNQLVDAGLFCMAESEIPSLVRFTSFQCRYSALFEASQVIQRRLSELNSDKVRMNKLSVL